MTYGFSGLGRAQGLPFGFACGSWDFLPSEDFPILVYFRETQTPAGSREEVPIEVDTLDGQVHFFPAISNSEQLKAQFIKNKCAKI